MSQCIWKNMIFQILCIERYISNNHYNKTRPLRTSINKWWCYWLHVCKIDVIAWLSKEKQNRKHELGVTCSKFSSTIAIKPARCAVFQTVSPSKWNFLGNSTQVKTWKLLWKQIIKIISIKRTIIHLHQYYENSEFWVYSIKGKTAKLWVAHTKNIHHLIPFIVICWCKEYIFLGSVICKSSIIGVHYWPQNQDYWPQVTLYLNFRAKNGLLIAKNSI